MKLQGIIITPYMKNHESAVRDFNYRLKAGGGIHCFPTSYISKWIPKLHNRNIYQEYFVAIDNEGMIRGGYIIKHQIFYVMGKLHSIANLQLPISEGIIDKKFMRVAILLYANAIKVNQKMYG